MATSESKVSQTLAALGVTTAEQVQSLFAEVRTRFDSEAAAVTDETSWKTFRDTWLARKSGVLTLVTDNWLKPATPDLKRAVGASLNELRAHVDAQIEARRLAAEAGGESAAKLKDRIDLSLPGVIRPIGTHHLIRQVFQEIEDIFFSIGFSVVEGPEIETPYYNFEALNIPEHHPVRDDMDTFYLDLPKGAPGPLLLRTHTSPVQIRTMEKRQPPVRVIVPGKVYRRDNPDATHSFMFHQIEGSGSGYRHHFLRFHRHHRLLRETVFWRECEDAFSPQLFSIHRALRRVRRVVRFLWWHRHRQIRRHLRQM